MSMEDNNYLQQFVDEYSFTNRLVLGALLPGWIWQPLPHMVQSWLRNYFGAILLYLLSSFLWSFYVYVYKYNVYIPEGDIPTRRAMWLQIKIAMKAMPWYAVFSTISEYMVENGWTRCYSSINEVGRVAYAWNLFLNFIITEFLIYWTHRLLHDIKPLYKHLHSIHHIYNKQNTLSPFAGFAFHPLDGILQGIPHVIVLFFVPTHFTTHSVLLLLQGIWTANIHDCIHGNVWPVLGAGYHTVHHITYRHDYGNYTVWMDWIFGTLQTPALEGEAKKI